MATKKKTKVEEVKVKKPAKKTAKKKDSITLDMPGTIGGAKLVFAEPKVGDIVVFTYNGNETVMGTNIHLAIFDQLRAIIK